MWTALHAFYLLEPEFFECPRRSVAKDAGDVGKNAVDENEGAEDSYSDSKKDHVHSMSRGKRERRAFCVSHSRRVATEKEIVDSRLNGSTAST